MMERVRELCRKLKPVLGAKVDRLWRAYLAESDAEGKADIEQTFELLAAKHLGTDYQPDRAPFPPPEKDFSTSGDIRLGSVAYGNRELYPFYLKSGRLKEHLLIAGRSGSGKTNLTFVLMQGIMDRGIKVIALDWKRGYRDLITLREDLLVYTIGREASPFRFNPLIPPAGCETHVWIKLIVDVIANAYLGGEGVISLLVAGLDHLFRQMGVFDHTQERWPTVADLLAWLRTTKLKGRAALWKDSAERILLGMTYSEFGAVINCQDNGMVQGLLDHNVVLEMDGLSSDSDRRMFSEALTLYLYRTRLVQGSQEKLTNLIILEEAHNLLLAKQAGTKESVLENSIRMIRQYGLGYVFVDQSASMLSKVAFANSYATIALSQKLRNDVQAMAGAMNLNDEQKESLNTLAIGTAVVRLADEHPEPFLLQIPRSRVCEGSVSDEQIRHRMASYPSDSSGTRASMAWAAAVSTIPAAERKAQNPGTEHESRPPTLRNQDTAFIPDHLRESRPPTPRVQDAAPLCNPSEAPQPPTPHAGHQRSLHDLSSQLDPARPAAEISREAVRFLADVAERPLSTTVSRYQRLRLSRRRGNAIRQELLDAGLIEAVRIATRSGQVILNGLTDHGRGVCGEMGVDPGPCRRTSLEHSFWQRKAQEHFEKMGYAVGQEHSVQGDGVVDLLAERPGERVAVEVETGKSDVLGNIEKLRGAGFDRVVLVATSPEAAATCGKAGQEALSKGGVAVEILTWLDMS